MDLLCQERGETYNQRFSHVEKKIDEHDKEISSIKASNDVQSTQINNLCVRIDSLVKTVNKLIYLGGTSLLAMCSFLIKEMLF